MHESFVPNRWRIGEPCGSVVLCSPGLRLARAYDWIEYPPSTGIAVPVTKSDAAVDRKTAVPASSPVDCIYANPIANGAENREEQVQSYHTFDSI